MRASIAPKDLAAALGVSESSVKRWADDGRLRVSRTLGGHRRISMPDAVAFVRLMGVTLVRPEALGLSELEHLPKELQAPTEAGDVLYKALENGDAPVVRGVLQSLFVNGSTAAAIFDGPMRSAMSRIGDLWQHQEWGIVVEHRATEIAVAAVNQLRMIIGSPAQDAPTAVGGAPGNDLYVLPSLMVAATLAECGFKDINLGAQTPLSGLAAAAERYESKVAWLSLSVAPAGRNAGEEICQAGARLAEKGITLVVGGRAAPEFFPPAKGERAGVYVMESLTDLFGFARGLLARAGA